MNRPRRSPSRDPHRRWRSGDAGDTLIEILVAVAIIGISATGIIGGLAAALGSSGTHRSLSTLDSIVRSFAETAKYDIQLQSANRGQATVRAVRVGGHRITRSPAFLIPSSGPVGTAVTVFGSGFAPPGGNLTLVLTSIKHPNHPTPVNATATVGANGNLTATFIVPTLPTRVVHDPNPRQQRPHPQGFLNTAAPFTVTTGPEPGSSFPRGPLPGRFVRPSSTGTATLRGQCTTASPYDQLQQLTISASAPGANDQLNFVVADPNYVFPAPVVTTVIGQVGATAAGFLQSGAPFYIYADATSPDGQPGVDPASKVTASFDNSTLTVGPTYSHPVECGGTFRSRLPTGILPIPQPAAHRCLRTDGVSVHFTVNAVDKDHVPSEYSDNGTVTFDNDASHRKYQHHKHAATQWLCDYGTDRGVVGERVTTLIRPRHRRRSAPSTFIPVGEWLVQPVSKQRLGSGDRSDGLSLLPRQHRPVRLLL